MNAGSLVKTLTRGAARVTRPLAVVTIAGPDARRFTNNMFTNNVRDLPVGAVNRHAMTDDRGRVQGFLDLLCEADDRFVAMVDGLDAAAFVERFETYIVFDDVEMTPRPELQGHVVIGTNALAAVEAFLPVPEPGQFASGEWGYAWRYTPGPEALSGVAFALADPSSLPDLRELDDAAATLVRVAAGRPVFPTDTGEKGLPHELGLRDELLSFDKGCYLGQESINRIDVMGQVKRHLRAVLVPGVAVDEAELQVEGKRVGRLTSPVFVEGLGTVGLAVLKQVAAEPDTKLDAVVGEASMSATVWGLPVPLERLG